MSKSPGPAIGDYGLIGDCETAALVGLDGSIDWLCWPRFDSEACLAALLGDRKNGFWRVAAADPEAKVSRRYLPDSLVLETRYETAEGAVRVLDFMPPRGEASDLVRMVEGERGRLKMRCALSLRFDYGRLTPWIEIKGNRLTAIAGPHAVRLAAPIPMQRGDDGECRAEFEVGEGERSSFVMTYFPSHRRPPKPVEPEEALKDAQAMWSDWIGRCEYQGPWREAVHRSLITLKALTYRPTGGVLAAPTTSLPEKLGGSRNWDYRFCWLRDATFTLMCLLYAGYREEAKSWREWLLRAVAGEPAKVQPVYGIAGEHRLTEWEADWLPGMAGSAPVRIGNVAFRQHQIDVYGEVIDALHQAREAGIEESERSWALQKALLEHLEARWSEPDDGIWESRSGAECFTHSRVMAWVAFDRAVKAVEKHGLDGPVDRYRQLRDTIHEIVCEKGFDPRLNAFTRSFGSTDLDASTLLIPLVGFLPADDPRVVGTVEAVQSRLVRDGFVMRYDTDRTEDGLPAGEGVFLACSFWMVDNLVLQGRRDEARVMYERLLGLSNDLGLLAEEYDPASGQLLGNFPQALSHLALVDSAYNLAKTLGPAHERGEAKERATHPEG